MFRFLKSLLQKSPAPIDDGQIHTALLNELRLPANLNLCLDSSFRLTQPLALPVSCGYVQKSQSLEPSQQYSERHAYHQREAYALRLAYFQARYKIDLGNKGRTRSLRCLAPRYSLRQPRHTNQGILN